MLVALRSSGLSTAIVNGHLGYSAPEVRHDRVGCSEVIQVQVVILWHKVSSMQDVHGSKHAMHVELKDVPVSDTADHEVWIRVEERSPNPTAFGCVVGKNRFLRQSLAHAEFELVDRVGSNLKMRIV